MIDFYAFGTSTGGSAIALISAGNAYTIVDIAAYPTVVSIDEPDRRRFAKIVGWTAEVGARPAVARGMAVSASD